MSKEILELEKQFFIQTYNRIPLNISHGEGVHLFDKKGKKYLDLFSGLGVNALGYSHPAIISAVTKQITKFAHLSNNFITDIQIEFSEKLLKYSGKLKLFLTNSGTEAVEAAVKLIRMKYGANKNIYSLKNSFHGRTYAAMTLTGRDKYKKGFEPLLDNISQIEFNDTDDLLNKIDHSTAAFFLEFIQGEGGINEVSQKFVDELELLRQKYGFLIVSDGIQCGTGRTGKAYSHNHFDLVPDIIVTAKAIGGGLPIGALMVSDELSEVIPVGKHGTTFGGNPISCAAGLVVLEEVYENGLMEKVKQIGEYFKSELFLLKEKYSNLIIDVRGKGLMIGIQMSFPCSQLVKDLLNKSILSNCTNENVIRLLPPLIISKADIDFFLFNFEQLLKNGNYGT
jgi:predicted acetylornithine/succinylornithine family transaminase